MTASTRADCAALDAATPPALQALAARFAPGEPDTLYFDANSIGPMPADVPQRMQTLLDAGWRAARRRSWNDADWLSQPRSLGAAVAPLLGAQADEVQVCDSTSINWYKLLQLGLRAAAPRRVLVVQADGFPSNSYVAQGIAHAGGAALRRIAHIDQLNAALAPGDVAVVALSHVDYRSSVRLDLAAITALAHQHGALALWDVSHSAGAVGVDLNAAQADLAVGCGYKYLCGGPGAPALMFVARRWQDAAWPALAGWMGHADTFAFAADYQPARGMARHQVGTPAVIANACFAAAAAIWVEVDAGALAARHASLGDTFIQLLDQDGADAGLHLASPRQAQQRGGHVALRFAAPGADVQALGQALVAAGVVVSTRKPDALRFGLHPLTTRHVDLWEAVQRLRAILADARWREPRFQAAMV